MTFYCHSPPTSSTSRGDSGLSQSEFIQQHHFDWIPLPFPPAEIPLARNRL